MPRSPGPDGEPVGVRRSSLAAHNLPPVQAAITVPYILGSPMAVAGFDGRAG